MPHEDEPRNGGIGSQRERNSSVTLLFHLFLPFEKSCTLCWCEAACLAGKKGKARSELFEHCRQVFHSSWNSLFVGPGIAKDQPPASQRLQAIGRDGQNLNTDLRG